VPSLSLKHIFYNSREALVYLQQNAIDVVFTEIGTPVISGLELAAEINPNQRIIFLSAHQHYVIETFRHYVVDYLVKSLTFRRLLASVEKIPGLIQASHLRNARLPFTFIRSSWQLVRGIIRIYFLLKEKMANGSEGKITGDGKYLVQ